MQLPAESTDSSGLKKAVRRGRAVAERLRQVRLHLYGEQGSEQVAGQLGIPARTWVNYERGVTMPAEVMLAFLELTGIEPSWLLHGRGRPFGSLLTANEPHPN